MAACRPTYPKGAAGGVRSALVWIAVAGLGLGSASCTLVRKWEEVADKAKETFDAIEKQGISGVPRPLGSVQGWIIDESGEPLSGAFVSVGDDTVQTTVGGTYMVRNLQPGEYSKIIRKEGFVSAQEKVKVKGNDQTSNDATLVPEGTSRSAGVEGTVSSTSGAPIAGARVEILGYPERVSTDAKGRYRLSGAHPGTRAIVAEAEGYAPQFRNMDLEDGSNVADLSLKTHREEWEAALEDGAARLTRAAEIVMRASTKEGIEQTEDLDLAMLQLRAVLEDLYFLREDAGRANR